jgi:AcrR family transcriptional regulator
MTANRPVGRFHPYPLNVDRRALILDAARRLTLERGVVPSLNETAALAGVSKGGLTHHFPSRTALVQGLAVAALEEIDQAMTAAAAEGRAAETWLHISVPTGAVATLFRALAIAHRAVEAPGDPVAIASREAIDRWETLIQQETGDAVGARVVRLVGDGLAANVIAGIEPAPTQAELDALLERLVPNSRRHDR